MFSAVLSIAAGLLCMGLLAWVPWVEGGVLLSQQAVAVGGLSAAIVLLLLAGRGRVGGGVAPNVLLVAAAFSVWHWFAGQSVDGASSREAAAQLAGVAAAVVAGATLFRFAVSARVLLWAVVVTSGAVGVSGLIDVAGRDRSLFHDELEVFAAPFGPFVNPNNAAALLIVGLVSAVALLSSRFGRSEDDGDVAVAEVIAATAAAILLTASLLAAGSRSGVGCGGVAAAAAVLVARPLRPRTIAAAALAAGGLLYAATRITDVSWIAEAWQRSDLIAEDARFTHGREMLAAVRERPFFGWGPNTYGMVSRRFVESDGVLWFEHADSQWFETLVDGGVLGLALALAFVGSAAWGVLRRREDPASRLPVSAAGGVLVGLGLHSLFDNAVLAAGVWVPAGLVVGCGSMRRPAGAWAFPALITAAAAGVGAWELSNAARVQKVALAVPDLRDEASAAEATVEALLRRNAAALSLRPDDSLGHWTDARLRTYLAQLRMFQSPPRSIVRRFPTRPWPLFDPDRLHAIAASLPEAELADFRSDPAVSGPLAAALESSRQSLDAAPLRFRSRIREAELEWIDTPPRELAAARRAVDSLPGHAPTRHAVAGLAWSAGDFELLSETLPRVFRLTDRYDETWFRRLTAAFSVSQIVDDLVPDDPAVLLRLAASQTKEVDDPLRLALLRRAESLLETSGDGDRVAASRGLILTLRGDRAGGEEVFRDRLRVQPASPLTRRALARSLFERGEDREALVESQAAVASDRRTPEDFRLQTLIRQRLRNAAGR